MALATTFLDPAELARVTDLDLLARTAVLGFKSGLHRSVHTGSSAEFAQYRPYTQGDDPRQVDWRLYGRTDRLHVREHQDETNLRATILLDASASMDYGSGPVTKFRYAQMLAASLALLLASQHDAVGLAAYHHRLLVNMPPRVHPNHTRRILLELENLRPEGTTDAAGTLAFMGNLIAPRGMVILIADLLHPVEEVLVHLRSLRARRHDVLVLQVSDPAEQTFPFDRAVTLVDAEDGREQYAVPEAVREAYLANRAAHFEAIRAACLAAEIDIEEFTTDQPLDLALHHLIERRNRALLTASRRGGSVGGGR